MRFATSSNPRGKQPTSLLDPAGTAREARDMQIKHLAPVVALVVLGMISALAETPNEKRAKLSDEDQAFLDKFSTAWGTSVARKMADDGIYLDPQKLAAAFQAVLDGKEPAMNEVEIDDTLQGMQDFIAGIQTKKIDAFKKAFADFKGGEKKTTESGIQYEVITETKGPKPTAADRVTVHYAGRLTDGTPFDASVDRGEPSTFGLTGVIKGWTEGLQLMSPGSRYRFTTVSYTHLTLPTRS